jgi:hypothetical protein
MLVEEQAQRITELLAKLAHYEDANGGPDDAHPGLQVVRVRHDAAAELPVPVVEDLS